MAAHDPHAVRSPSQLTPFYIVLRRCCRQPHHSTHGSCKIVRDRDTKESRCYGYLGLTDGDIARRLCKLANKINVGGNVIGIKLARR